MGSRRSFEGVSVSPPASPVIIELRELPTISPPTRDETTSVMAWLAPAVPPWRTAGLMMAHDSRPGTSRPRAAGRRERRRVVRLPLLALLAKEPAHGYELKNRLEQM